MLSLNEAVSEYTRQLRSGTVQTAYRGIMRFMSQLKSYLEAEYPEYASSGVYVGYMDMTYFALTPPEYKKRGLKVAVVYLHAENRIELWLAAANKKIQREYHRLLTQKKIGTYALSEIAPGVDAIIASVAVENPDFDHPEAMKKKVMKHVGCFITDITGIITQL